MDTEPMSSYDLHILLDVPVLPAEAAHGRVAERPSLLVFNTNPSWIHRDGHWVAAYFDERCRGFFFDSFGRDAGWFGFDRFMADNCKTWIFNDRQLQSLESSACGHHVTAFSMAMMTGITTNTYLYSVTMYI